MQIANLNCSLHKQLMASQNEHLPRTAENYLMHAGQYQVKESSKDTMRIAIKKASSFFVLVLCTSFEGKGCLSKKY
jgi:hypothetical protein